MNPLIYDTYVQIKKKHQILIAFAYQVRTQKSGAELKIINSLTRSKDLSTIHSY